MDRSCYRCGAQIEERTTFCPSCGAPQIRVTVPAAANQPATLPPETPDSIEPPVVPERLGPVGRIQWRKFWRIGLPVAIISGLTITLNAPAGIVLFLTSVVLVIRRYRRDAGPLTGAHGMRLGAAIGFISYLVVVASAAIQIAVHFSEFQQQWILNIRQRVGANPDPQVQQVAHWAVTNQGILALGIISVMVGLVVVIVLSSIVGALIVALMKNRGP